MSLIKGYICGLCKTVNYCSNKCQKKHWLSHKSLCQSIAALEQQRQERTDQSRLFNSSFLQHGKEKVVELVGEKCVAKCMANKNQTVMLLDIEAQVFIVRKYYLTSNYLELIAKPLKEILENDDSFRVQSANSTQVPSLG